MKTLEKAGATKIIDDGKITRNAWPADRLLPEPFADGEEWNEIIEYENQEYLIIYYFEENELAEEAENLPWDFEHVAAIYNDDDKIYDGMPCIGFNF